MNTMLCNTVLILILLACSPGVAFAVEIICLVVPEVVGAVVPADAERIAVG